MVFPYPERYGGTINDDADFHEHGKDDKMMAFGIEVSQKDAANKVQEVEESKVEDIPDV